MLKQSLMISSLLAIAGNAMAEFSGIADPALSQCIKEQAISKGWATPESVLEIKCHNGNIQSIAGIQQFTQLKKLSLYKNKLTQIELPALPKLEHLNLAGNEIEHLNLGNYPVLKDFFVFKNRLKTLTIQQAPNLTKLKANNNVMTKLSFIDSPNLEKLYIFDNELEILDMEALPQLSYMDARHNPMSDDFYDYLDSLDGLTVLHDGNAEDWQ